MDSSYPCFILPNQSNRDRYEWNAQNTVLSDMTETRSLPLTLISLKHLDPTLNRYDWDTLFPKSETPFTFDTYMTATPLHTYEWNNGIIQFIYLSDIMNINHDFQRAINLLTDEGKDSSLVSNITNYLMIFTSPIVALFVIYLFTCLFTCISPCRSAMSALIDFFDSKSRNWFNSMDENPDDENQQNQQTRSDQMYQTVPTNWQ